MAKKSKILMRGLPYHPRKGGEYRPGSYQIVDSKEAAELVRDGIAIWVDEDYETPAPRPDPLVAGLESGDVKIGKPMAEGLVPSPDDPPEENLGDENGKEPEPSGGLLVEPALVAEIVKAAPQQPPPGPQAKRNQGK